MSEQPVEETEPEAEPEPKAEQGQMPPPISDRQPVNPPRLPPLPRAG